LKRNKGDKKNPQNVKIAQTNGNKIAQKLATLVFPAIRNRFTPAASVFIHDPFSLHRVGKKGAKTAFLTDRIFVSRVEFIRLIL